MAAKNYARFLPQAVASVQAQTMPDWELIIVNDGSTDATHDVVTPFLKDSRLRYVRCDALGQSRAKNLGVRLARARVIAFLDADDAWLPHKLEVQLPLLTDTVGVVHSDREWIDEHGMPVPTPAPPPRAKFTSIDDIYIRNPICFSSALMRKDIFDRVGGFDPSLDLSIDYDLWLRVAQHYAFAHVPERLVLYRTGHGNLSRRLADRITVAFTIMHRRGEGVTRRARHEAFAMTWRSRAWAKRGEHRAAGHAYLQALAHPHHRAASLRGLAGVVKDAFAGRAAATAENRSENG
jgi:glycosyltransferase involved in cell wall biosynthesis